MPCCTLESMVGERFEELANSDWAIYPGFVSECGKTEVQIDIRIPPQEFSPGEKMQFNRIKFAGAEPGMNIELSTACSLRPYFSSVPGYGSYVSLEDITHENMWLIDIVATICQMFNLVIFTDEQNKTVYIDTMEKFSTVRAILHRNSLMLSEAQSWEGGALPTQHMEPSRVCSVRQTDSLRRG